MSKALLIDWQRVVLNIRQTGMPVAQLAGKVGMDENTLRHYARGETREPRWTQAVRLLDVHADRCPEKHRIDLLMPLGIGARMFHGEPSAVAVTRRSDTAAIYSESA